MEAASNVSGLRELEAVEARVHSDDAGPGPEEMVLLVDRLGLAARLGLPLERSRDATRTFFMVVQDAIDREGRLIDLPEALVDPAIDAARDFWMRQVPLLPADVQQNAWHLLDILHANRIRRHYVEAVVEEAQAFVETSPLPAVQTALQLVVRFFNLGIRDQRLPTMLDLIERHSTSDVELATVAALRSRVDIAILDARGHLGGPVLDAFNALAQLNEGITEAFGGEVVVRLGDPEDTRGMAQDEEAARSLTAQVVEQSALLDRHDPACNGLLEFVMARIDAVSGSLPSAQRIFERLVERNFACWDSSQHLARAWLARDYPEDARSVLEGAAARVPLFKDELGLHEPLVALYREAGGDPVSLLLAEPPAAFAQAAEANRDVVRARFEAGVRELEARAVRDFWERRRGLILSALSERLLPEDVDAWMKGDVESPGRTLMIEPSLAAATSLSDMPGLPADMHRYLLEAIERPVPMAGMVGHLMNLIDAQEAAGRPFEEIIADFPAVGRSESLVVGRIGRLLDSGRIDDAVALLDRYEADPEVPDRLLVRIYDAYYCSQAGGDRWLQTLRRGRGIWARVRGEAGRWCGSILREACLERLAGESFREWWPELIEIILDTMPDYDIQEKIWDWYRIRFQGRAPSVAMVAMARRLFERLGSPYGTRARDLALDAIREGLPLLLSATETSRARFVIEDVLALETGNIDLETGVATWFAAWEPGGDRPLESKAELGEWLSERLSGEAANRARRQTGEHLVSMLREERRPDAQVGFMERLSALHPDDPELRRLLDEARNGTSRSWLPLAAILTGGLLIAAVLFIFLR
jgi:hypothetical protein